ncbi:hypothetical protein VTK73DRAFT_4528 [Phialemonium thermophilum]|uniref:Rho-GAP domain-containing protein n=1 Tax=Phialemonium thermophilum TaxID=223376 RepID=A0ABR3WTW4_9PEZI
MGRKPAPQPLALGDGAGSDEDPRHTIGETRPLTSPSESLSSRSPRSTFRFAQKKTHNAGASQLLQAPDILPQQPRLDQERYRAHGPPYSPISSGLYHRFESASGHTPQQQRNTQEDELSQGQHGQQFKQLPQQQHHQEHQQQQGRSRRRNDEDKASKSGFFHFARSSDRLNSSQQANTQNSAMSRDTDYTATSNENHTSNHVARLDQTPQEPSASLAFKSNPSTVLSGDYDLPGSAKKGKPKPFTLLGRTRSIKDKDDTSPQDAPAKLVEPEQTQHLGALPLRTAPVHAHDRSFRDMMSSAVRNHSAERPPPRDMNGQRGRDQEREQSRNQPSSYKENGGSAFLSGLKSSSSRAANIISHSLFGKTTRSASTTEKEPVVDDEHYVLKVINLPLVEQTRRTRISKRLEESRDKTEFWMPAFPWRAIDYLNYKGSDVEGLYRVPGSGPQIKKWQRKFDEELDVDLFSQKDLYDINIIGSMLKAWLRELPDELFPKEAQERIARECAGSETVPQMLIDELSNLSPFNYYLLFAITCHLSLLLAHADKNKMDFRNLCICFQPCMKIDAFCFKFLVCDWRDCWKGCKNEAKYIEEEYALFDQPPPRGLSEPRLPSPGFEPEEASQEQNVSSPDSSSKQSNQSEESQRSRLKKKALPVPEQANAETSSIVSTVVTLNSVPETPPRKSGDLRPLSPIKPLSPLGF